MTFLMCKLHAQGRSEAQAFFAEARPFPFAGATITFVAVANLAATIATLVGQG